MKNRLLSTIALILNIVIVALVGLSVISFYTPLFGELEESVRNTLYFYFTVQSNLLIGLVALFEIPFLVHSILKRRFLLPTWLHAVKLAAVTMTTITMVTALSWLSIQMGFDKMIEGANIFLHVITPALALLSFVFFEAQKRMKVKHAFYVLIPMAAYIAFYFSAVFFLDLGIKDWYLFAYDYEGGVRSENLNVLKSVLSIVIFLIAPVLLSLLIWLLNRGMYKVYFVRKPLPRPEDTRTPEGKKVVIIEEQKKEELAAESIDEVVEESAEEEDVESRPVDEESLVEQKVEVIKPEEEKPVKRSPTKKAPTKKSVEKIEPKKEKRSSAKKNAAPASEFGKYEGKTRVYHIAQSKTVDGQWQVKLAGGDKAIKIFKTQKEAIEFAKGLIRTQGGSIRIHSMKGKMRK